ncbi:MAG: COG1470 family protein, partial [Anaerolineae bacterium]
IPAGQEVEVTAKIRPAEKAVAGDYMVTVRASTEGTASESADFRITVRTSTLWGVVGVALIGIAVGVVALAVLRFGRR